MTAVSLTTWRKHLETALSHVHLLGVDEATLAALQNNDAYRAALELAREGQKLEDTQYGMWGLRNINATMEQLSSRLGKKEPNTYKCLTYPAKFICRPNVKDTPSLILGILYLKHIQDYAEVVTERTSPMGFQSGVNTAKSAAQDNCQWLKADIEAYLHSLDESSLSALKESLGESFYDSTISTYAPELNTASDVAAVGDDTFGEEEDDEEFYLVLEDTTTDTLNLAFNSFIREQFVHVFEAIPNDNAQAVLIGFNAKLKQLITHTKRAAYLKQYIECLEEAKRNLYDYREFVAHFQLGRESHGHSSHHGLINSVYIYAPTKLPDLNALKEASRIKQTSPTQATAPKAQQSYGITGLLSWLRISPATIAKEGLPEEASDIIRQQRDATISAWYQQSIDLSKKLIAEDARKIQHITSDSHEYKITDIDFIERPYKELHNLTSNLLQIEALTAIDAEIDQFIQRHHQPIITFISWGIIGKITNWLSGIRPLSYLINDKYLLFKDARAFQNKIHEVKESLRAMNDTQSVIGLRATAGVAENIEELIHEANTITDNAIKISKHSCYAFWRTSNKRAAEEQKGFGTACVSTLRSLISL